LAIKNQKRVAGRICSGFQQNDSKRKRVIAFGIIMGIRDGGLS
jgi:hypothetical protein